MVKRTVVSIGLLVSLGLLVYQCSAFLPSSLKSKSPRLLSPTASTSSKTSKIDGALTNIILYDGVCNFCNAWVDILLRLDSDKKFRFCALQSPKGEELLKSIGREANDISSVVLIKSLDLKEAYVKSDAVLKVAEQLGLGMYMTSVVGSFIPSSIRNKLYDTVANNRYKLLGKRDRCRVSDPNLSDRFIEDGSS